MEFRTIKEEAKEALLGNRFMFFLALLITSLICGALAPVFGVGIIIAPIMTGGLYLIGRGLLKKEGFDINTLFSLFKDLNHALKLIGVYFLTGLIVFLGSLAFIIPGIIFYYQYSQAVFVMTENPQMGIWEAMEESKRLMVGHKFEFFIFHLSFILHFLLVGITFGLYLIYFLPYYNVSIYNYYLHLSGQDNVKIQNDRIPDFEF